MELQSQNQNQGLEPRPYHTGLQGPGQMPTAHEGQRPCALSTSTFLSACQVPPFSPREAPGGGFVCYPHCTGEDSEAQEC